MLPLALLLLAAWSWDRVLTDCNGAPETVKEYRLRATVRYVSPTGGNCTDDQGLPYICPGNIPGTPIPFGPVIPEPATGTQVSTTFDPVADPSLLPNPPVGGLSAWPWTSVPDNPATVIATDLAGNVGVCP